LEGHGVSSLLKTKMSTGPERSARRSGGVADIGERLVRTSEIIVIAATGLLVIAAVLIATVVAYALFIQGVRTNLTAIGSLDALELAVQRVFGGVLILLLGLELLETLKTYFKDYHIRTEVIIVVALIAVGRHIVLIDFEHTSGGQLVGTASLIVALAVSYFLIRARGWRANDESTH
jgi:uncharacterized membrane protein (DUF373 family)